MRVHVARILSGIQEGRFPPQPPQRAAEGPASVVEVGPQAEALLLHAEADVRHAFGGFDETPEIMQADFEEFAQRPGVVVGGIAVLAVRDRVERMLEDAGVTCHVAGTKAAVELYNQRSREVPVGALVVAGLLRISSLAGLTAAALGPVWALVLGRPDAVLIAILLGALIFERHRANIRRLLAGEEPRIGKS